ncbi:sigma-54-dependent transcriptional regulator [Dichotomicrobium thermohalophilum]|uniref:DNA-binding NtrC family response regulator n=1 Tax=Dichotomicrobium thermohalophilum TaxID=933063 RepID=A0A397QC70_9HYPH|nr:sigma-54 dependent transcriptional regulator [Dichotomicrobium thermohalophilum]RIA55694.1 DNA-binding NtrC family response regulator [Dichotomicrobium thermohalophilum]
MTSLDGKTIAIVEDDAIMGESLMQSLCLEGAMVRLFASGEAIQRETRLRDLDLIVCDIRLPGIDGACLFETLQAQVDAPPFLFMTAYGEIDQAVALMREGAADYVTKPFEMDDFLRRVQSSLRPAGPSDGGVLGVSPAMREVEALLGRIANLDSPVLLSGETGTGKEVCARFLHGLSRPKAPFMAVNCAAIPAELLESELFGHEAGAFTSARKRHLGYAERAGTGTLFLDEIGELAMPLQAKLLRLLEDRQFYRLGGESPVPFQARLIAATNADLDALIRDKRFRSDLYYRINVVEARIPPLRERPEDISWLIERFFDEMATVSQTLARGITAPAEQTARAHPWPGNVRELRNRMERALALNLTGWIGPQDLFPEQAAVTAGDGGARSLADAREAAEKQQIQLALSENEGRIGKTAAALGVSRTTLWEKMKRYGLTGDALS